MKYYKHKLWHAKDTTGYVFYKVIDNQWYCRNTKWNNWMHIKYKPPMESLIEVKESEVFIEIL